jgi:hypothetical protein
MSESGENNQVPEVTTAKKPYAAPQLKHLGSVRELTLGNSPGNVELGGTRKK